MKHLDKHLVCALFCHLHLHLEFNMEPVSNTLHTDDRHPFFNNKTWIALHCRCRCPFTCYSFSVTVDWETLHWLEEDQVYVVWQSRYIRYKKRIVTSSISCLTSYCISARVCYNDNTFNHSHSLMTEAHHAGSQHPLGTKSRHCASNVM